MEYRYWIGIDPGHSTGVATWDAKEMHFLRLRTCKVDEAIEYVCDMIEHYPGQVAVVYEDAHRYGLACKRGAEVRLGAGAIMRESTIWRDFLKRKGIYFEAKAPKDHPTKLSEAYFRWQSGWKGRSSEHSRDAGTLVWNKAI